MEFHTLKLTILSPAILEALRSVVRYYPDLDLRSDEVTVTSPYPSLAHHLDSLKLYRDKLKDSKDQTHSFEALEKQKTTDPPDHQVFSTTCNATAATHLTHLLNYLDTTAYGDRIQKEQSLNDKGLCTFAMLWLLYKPGTTVYTRERSTDIPSAMVIKSVEIDPAIMFRNDNERTPYSIEMWNLEYDGRRVGRRLHTMEMEQFHGERSITSLEVFPASFLDTEDNGKTKQVMVNRGIRWFGLLKGKMILYGGPFVGVGSRLAKPVRTWFRRAGCSSNHEP